MRNYEIKITGNGTLNEIAFALMQMADHLEPNSILNLDYAQFANIDKVKNTIDIEVQPLSLCCRAPLTIADDELSYCSNCGKLNIS